MQLILIENILNLGKIGDVVKVKDGYGRNYLLKNGKALKSEEKQIGHHAFSGLNNVRIWVGFVHKK